MVREIDNLSNDPIQRVLTHESMSACRGSLMVSRDSVFGPSHQGWRDPGFIKPRAFMLRYLENTHSVPGTTESVMSNTDQKLSSWGLHSS